MLTYSTLPLDRWSLTGFLLSGSDEIWLARCWGCYVYSSLSTIGRVHIARGVGVTLHGALYRRQRKVAGYSSKCPYSVSPFQDALAHILLLWARVRLGSGPWPVKLWPTLTYPVHKQQGFMFMGALTQRVVRASINASSRKASAFPLWRTKTVSW